MSIEPQIAASPAPTSSQGRRLGRGVSAVLGFVFTVFLTFLGLLAITFFIGRVIPIDPVLAVVGDRATPAVYEAAKVQMGLDQPLPIQFFNYVVGVFSGDLGKSVSTGRAVADDLSRFFPATLEMATIGIIIGVALGVPLGVIAASRQGSVVDQVIRVVGLLGYSMPAFWLGVVGWGVFVGGVGGGGGAGAARHFL